VKSENDVFPKRIHSEMTFGLNILLHHSLLPLPLLWQVTQFLWHVTRKTATKNATNARKIGLLATNMATNFRGQVQK
jgi:hypothetical protein